MGGTKMNLIELIVQRTDEHKIVWNENHHSGPNYWSHLRGSDSVGRDALQIHVYVCGEKMEVWARNRGLAIKDESIGWDNWDKRIAGTNEEIAALIEKIQAAIIVEENPVESVQAFLSGL